MKKIILLIGIYFVTFLNLYSQEYIHFTDENNAIERQISTTPQRNVLQNSNSVDIEYNIQGATIQTIANNTTNYSILRVKGFGLSGEEGNPALPSYEDIIAVPGSSNLSIDIINSEYKDIENYTIYPAQGPDMDNDTIKPFRINQAAYQSNIFIPEHWLK